MSGFGVSISSAICIMLLIVFAMGVLSAALETFQVLNEAFETSLRTQQDIFQTQFKFSGNITSTDYRVISFCIENVGSKSFSSTELTLFDLFVHYQINSTTNRVVWIPYVDGDIAEEGWNYTFERNYLNNPSSWDPSESIKVTTQLRFAMASKSSNFLQFSSSNGVAVSTYFEVK